MNGRLTRLDALMCTAVVFSGRATCSRTHVGAVLARDGRILSTGYNGAPPGLPHCVHESDEPCLVAEHAERNAIYFAARHGLSTEGSILVTTHQPCYECAKAIISAGIVQVVWNLPYRLTAGIDLLREASILCVPYFEGIDG